MALEAGDALPQELLATLRTGARWQVLYFMRTADCAVCRSHVRRLQALAPTLRERDVELIILAPDERAPDWAASSGVPLVLGPAPVRAAGFGRTLGAVQQSGTVVAREGKVVSIRRATLPFQAFDERELLALLQGAGSPNAVALAQPS